MNRRLLVLAGAVAALGLASAIPAAQAQQPKVIDVKVGTVTDLDGDGRAIDPAGFANEGADDASHDRPKSPATPPPVARDEDCDADGRPTDDCSK
jgi:opacity protein-like surface antigen